jgi:MFS family permease
MGRCLVGVGLPSQNAQTVTIRASGLGFSARHFYELIAPWNEGTRFMSDRESSPVNDLADEGSSDGRPGTARHVLALLAVLLAAAMLQAADSSVSTGLSTRAGIAGYANEIASAIGAAYWLGYLAGCFGASRIMRRVGHIRVFAAAAATCCIAVLAIQIVPGLLWIVGRFVMGVMMATLWAVTDSWIGDKAPPTLRGTVLAIYAIVGALGVLAGQIIVAQVDVAAPVFGMIAAALFAAALIPIALTRTEAPLPPATTALMVRRMFVEAPAAAFGVTIVGILVAVFFTMMPYFMSELGLPRPIIGTALGVAIAGRLILQWPMGRLSDLVDRRLVLAGAGIVSAISMLVAINAGDAVPILLGEEGDGRRLLLYAMIGLWGGVSLTLYSICVAHAHDRFNRSEMVPVTNTALLLYGVGAVAGPILAALAIDIAGIKGVGYIFVAGGLMLSMVTGYRMIGRRKPPAAEQIPFADIPTTSITVAPLQQEADDAANAQGNVRA